MAQIMEFILNLLLLRGKFLTSTAVETVHEAIRKCLQFKRKISTEYKEATQMIGPFENMLEFVNYNAREYTCEGNNYVVTNEVHYELYEEPSKMKHQDKQELKHHKSNVPIRQSKSGNFDSAGKKLEGLSRDQKLNAIPDLLRRGNHRPKSERKTVNEDHIVDNLHAILKSQEFLFKNIVKLVNILEKGEVLTKHAGKLDKVKKKLVACTDVLSNSAYSPKLSNVINNIIEEEITRCRFRHGGCKTSAEINLKIRRPQGIEAALKLPHNKNDIRRIKKKSDENTRRSKTKYGRIVKSKVLTVNNRKNELLRRSAVDFEAKFGSKKFLRGSKSEPVVYGHQKQNNIHTNIQENYKTVLKQTHVDIENSKKLIEINEGHFNKFEATLWHSLTTMKFLSLKDEYRNMCKCAFYNKRQFVTTESGICKTMKKDEEAEHLKKFESMSDSAFELMERKLRFEEVQKKFEKGDHRAEPAEPETKPAVINVETVPKENPFTKLIQLMPQSEVKKKIQISVVEDNTEQINVIEKVKAQLDKNRKKGETTEKAVPLKSEKFGVQNENKMGLKTSSRIEESNQKVTEPSEKITKSKNGPSVVPKISKGAVAVQEQENQKVPEFHDQETNTVINSFNLAKHVAENEKRKTQEQTENKSTDSKVVEIRPIEQSSMTESSGVAQDLKNNHTSELKTKTVEASEKRTNTIITNSSLAEKTTEVNISPIIKGTNDIDRPENKKVIPEVQKIIIPNISASDSVKIIIKRDPKKKETKQGTKAIQSSTVNKIAESNLVENASNNARRKEIQKDPPRNMKNLVENMSVPCSSGVINQKGTITTEVHQDLTKIDNATSSASGQVKTRSQGPQSDPKDDKHKITINSVENITVSTDNRGHITSARGNTKNTVNDNVKNHSQKVSPRKDENHETGEKRAMAKILEKHSKNIELFVAGPMIDRKNSSKTPSLKISLRKNKKTDNDTKTPETKVEKLKPVTAKAPPLRDLMKKRTGKEIKSVSMLEFKSEAELIQVNKKAFDELEATIRTVKIFINKRPSTSTSKSALKTTTENRKRKIDESPKKSMSTKHLPLIMKQSKIVKEETKVYSFSKSRADEMSQKKNNLQPEDKKQATKYSLPKEKCKTFLKKSSKRIWQRNTGSSQKSESKKFKHSLAKPVSPEFDEKNKSNSQMRRTTKNAMKRQQVLTIFPKVSKEGEEKKKPQISLVETDETEAAKTKQLQRKKGDGASILLKNQTNFGTVAKTIYPRNFLRSSAANKEPRKEKNGTAVNSSEK